MIKHYFKLKSRPKRVSLINIHLDSNIIFQELL